MGIRVALHHKTVYQYDRAVTLSPQVVRLRPAPHSRTPVHSYSLRVEPAGHFINWQQDPQGNFQARLTFPEPTRVFSLEVDLVAEMTVLNPFDFFLEPYAEQIPFAYSALDGQELTPYLLVGAPGPRLAGLLESIPRTAAPAVSFLVDLNRRIHRAVRYVIRLEHGVQSSEETIEKASGSCRDSAWLLVEVLRHLGLAARFVSGYLIQLVPDVTPIEGPAGPAHDFTDLHAWAEVYLPGAGWVGLDPTSGLLAGEGHIPLAATPSPESAAPVTGLVSESRAEFRHEMSVTRIHEDPRVTRPYTEAQWASILRLGEQVDRDLAAGDVRLTMGGEPTFVSIDNMEGAEWNTAALGEDKARLAATLLTRLRAAFAPGGVLHFGQGKWYPGEPLPRWAYTCIWRTDGVPLWRDAALAADPAREGGFGVEDARAFADALADRLQLARSFVMPAFEDPLVHLQAEGQLPVKVDPESAELADADGRARLRHVLSRGLGTPVGFVLPLGRATRGAGPRWQSSTWPLRTRHLLLVPGDSPVGLRLPMKSLPEGPAVEVTPVDPLGTHPPLDPPVHPEAARASQEPKQKQKVGTARAAAVRATTSAPARARTGSVEPPLVRTALTVEARGGNLRVFLPPVESAVDFADLVTAIEDTARALTMPVLLEGYTPPFDPRLQRLSVTPDPGVIEVNVHPSASWASLVATTTTLYDEARVCRLGTEKFMVDGRHTGTGGGNHVVLGGPTPADSPFLRRPDLLKSVVGYWLNHPSLSYLFSGVFVGPTSQAPRVDEARPDAVDELEIAMSLLDGEPEACPPWLVDRLFRDLLVDVTGNTHRAEFCIDKLYAPESATGRLGLVEMRAFEMPPHARMSLAQQLLVRTLVAWFWRAPYAGMPIRWGTRLHDRFLLPHFVTRDFSHVVEDVRCAGYAVDPAWFSPHLEFRFPVYGRVCYEGIEIELRQAIEPWYVLGEEGGAAGTARYVDSSLERVQVKVTGLTAERYVVACNGWELPLQNTGTHGEYVCGVRYRAWQPARCLHPTIPVHVPLVFDLVDTAMGRSVGGCTYRVGHPGGRNYDAVPVNSNEAEARRRTRFEPFGHTPGALTLHRMPIHPAFSHTLDLRRTHVPAGSAPPASA